MENEVLSIVDKRTDKTYEIPISNPLGDPPALPGWQ